MAHYRIRIEEIEGELPAISKESESEQCNSFPAEFECNGVALLMDKGDHSTVFIQHLNMIDLTAMIGSDKHLKAAAEMARFVEKFKDI